MEAGTSEELFLLVDDTDVCVIDPEGAEVTPSSRDIWYGNSPRPSSGPSSSWLSLAVVVYRYSEQRLDVGQHSYAIGDFKTMGTDYHGDLRQDVIAKLRAWKQDAHKIHAFDTNHDDEVDVEEWEHVRRVAEREAMLERTQRSIMDGDTRDRRHPFLLSAMSQHPLAQCYRQYAVLGFVAFVALGGLGTWLFLTRYTI